MFDAYLPVAANSKPVLTASGTFPGAGSSGGKPNGIYGDQSSSGGYTSFTITCSATGGKPPYTFALYCETVKVKDLSSGVNTCYTDKNYQGLVTVRVTDSAGKVTTSDTLAYVTTYWLDWAPYASPTYSATNSDTFMFYANPSGYYNAPSWQWAYMLPGQSSYTNYATSETLAIGSNRGYIGTWNLMITATEGGFTWSSVVQVTQA